MFKGELPVQHGPEGKHLISTGRKGRREENSKKGRKATFKKLLCLECYSNPRKNEKIQVLSFKRQAFLKLMMEMKSKFEILGICQL